MTFFKLTIKVLAVDGGLGGNSIAQAHAFAPCPAASVDTHLQGHRELWGSKVSRPGFRVSLPRRKSGWRRWKSSKQISPWGQSTRHFKLAGRLLAVGEICHLVGSVALRAESERFRGGRGELRGPGEHEQSRTVTLRTFLHRAFVRTLWGTSFIKYLIEEIGLGRWDFSRVT